MLGQFARRVAQVLHESGAVYRLISSAVANSSQTIQLAATEFFGVFDRGSNPLPELRDAFRKDGNAALAGSPVPRWKIVQHLDQLLFAEFRGQSRLFEFVGEEKLHALKSRRSCGCEPLHERQFSEQHGQIGCELRQVAILSV